jgi:hypothetical protein
MTQDQFNTGHAVVLKWYRGRMRMLSEGMRVVCSPFKVVVKRIIET